MTSKAAREAARSNGTSSTGIDLVSRKTRCPARACSDAIWSMTPVGAPTTSFSALRAAAASSSRDSCKPGEIVPREGDGALERRGRRQSRTDGVCRRRRGGRSRAR